MIIEFSLYIFGQATFQYWIPGYSNNENIDCVELITGISGTGGWNITDCAYPKKAFCQTDTSRYLYCKLIQLVKSLKKSFKGDSSFPKGYVKDMFTNSYVNQIICTVCQNSYRINGSEPLKKVFIYLVTYIF